MMGTEDANKAFSIETTLLNWKPFISCSSFQLTFLNLQVVGKQADEMGYNDVAFKPQSCVPIIIEDRFSKIKLEHSTER